MSKEALEKKLEKLKRGLVSLEILKVPKNTKSLEEAEEVYDKLVTHKSYFIDDLSRPYLIKLAYTEDKSKIRNTDPETIDDGDVYELTESIQEILRENLLPVIKSQFPEKPDYQEAEIEEDIDE